MKELLNGPHAPRWAGCPSQFPAPAAPALRSPLIPYSRNFPHNFPRRAPLPSPRTAHLLRVSSTTGTVMATTSTATPRMPSSHLSKVCKRSAVRGGGPGRARTAAPRPLTHGHGGAQPLFACSPGSAPGGGWSCESPDECGAAAGAEREPGRMLELYESPAECWSCLRARPNAGCALCAAAPGGAQLRPAEEGLGTPRDSRRKSDSGPQGKCLQTLVQKLPVFW